MSGASFPNALADFDIALETANETLIARVADSVVYIDYIDTVLILDEGDDGVARVNREALVDLLDRLEKASRAIRDAHNDFNWEVGRAYRALKNALANAPSTSTPAKEPIP